MITPDAVSAASKRRGKETLRFRTFLKNRADPDKLDQQFAKLHKELFFNTIAVNAATFAGRTAAKGATDMFFANAVCDSEDFRRETIAVCSTTAEEQGRLF